MKKFIHKDLQPWIDYFKLLQEYEAKGYLEVMPDKNEAYITRAAIHAMTPGSDPASQTGLPESARLIRAYSGWKSGQGIGYLQFPFAVHVVKEESPHDLIYTLLLTSHYRWWLPWKKSEVIEMIDYTAKR